MEVLTKKIMEYFDLTFLNKSDLEEYLSRSAACKNINLQAKINYEMLKGDDE